MILVIVRLIEVESFLIFYGVLLLCCQAEEELRDKKAVFGELNVDLSLSLPAFYTEYVLATSRLCTCILNIFYQDFV